MKKELSGYASPKALDISNEMILEALSQIDEGVLIVDEKGEIVFYNRFHGIIDGLAPEQVIGKKVTDVYDLSKEESLTFRCLARGRPISQEFISYKPNEGVVVNSINSIYPIRKNGRMVGCISLLKDYKVLKTLVAPDPPKPVKEFKKKTRYTFSHIKGGAKQHLAAITTARKSAASASAVMLCGETGTGKEMFAQSIHNAGPRREYAFVAVNCAAIPENLFEGLLFGTRKGAFTGAMDQKGLFEQANGGTLFLDEIDSMPISLQTKMLRAIQEQKIRRVGELEEIPIDIRIISSTSTPPRTILCEKGRFRKDLFYRLAVVMVKLPPLRDREDDVSLLTRHFLDRFNRRLNRRVDSVSRAVMALFYNYDWPGNVRELGHVIEGAMNLLDQADVMDIEHVAPYFRTVAPLFLDAQKQLFSPAPDAAPAPEQIEPAAPVEDPGPPELPAQKEETKDGSKGEKSDKQVIYRALKEAGGKIKTACETLGISRQLLHYRIRKYGIDSRAIASACESQELETALAACDQNLTRTAERLGISLQLLNYRLKKHGMRPLK
ncbi:MAG: sigma 54-interacting transcriptional regulator [Desulfobacter sp.]|nr:MAG: sigma 54-interacting transcriptional regulator [Desulfobacter sp.]